MRVPFLGLLALATSLLPLTSTAQPVQAVSRPYFGNQWDTGGAESSTDTTAVASADGRYVVFVSWARNLVQGEIVTPPGPLLPPFFGAVYLRDRATQTTSVVSHAAGSSLTASYGVSPTLSEDGGYAGFTSRAPNIVPGTQVQDNAYLYERTSGQVTLVSHALGLPTTDGNGPSQIQSLSADGRYAAFLSSAGDLVGNEPAGFGNDVYLYDRVTGLNTLVSHLPGDPTARGGGDCSKAVMSGDGAFVAFACAGDGLVVGSDLNSGQDVFLFERATGTITLVSHAFGQPTTAGSSASIHPDVSDDGRIVTFSSQALDLLATPDPGIARDIFGFDRNTGTVFLASRSVAGPEQPGNLDSHLPVVSGDGQRIAFESFATDLVSGTDTNGASDVFAFDVTSASLRLVSHAAGSPGTAGSGTSNEPRMSADGTRVAFSSNASDLVAGFVPDGFFWNVFVYSWTSGTTTLASHVPGSTVQQGHGHASRPSVSADGNVVVFESTASDLVAGDGNVVTDVFGYSPPSGQVEAVSRRAPGMPALTGNAYSQTAGTNLPKLSADGRYVVFKSYATNLVQGLQKPSEQIFLGIYLTDMATATTVFVSHAPGDPTVPGCGLDPILQFAPDDAVVSGDGGAVAFTCPVVYSLSEGVTDQVYLYDRATQGLSLASHAYTGMDQPGFGNSGAASISLDGSRVAFVSSARDLTNGNFPLGMYNVFLYDRGTGNVTLVSHAAGQPNEPADSYSYRPLLSGDGSRVIFASAAGNLVPGISNPEGYPNVYLYDVATGTTVLVSHAAGSLTTPTAGLVYPGGLSDDGRFATFDSDASDLVPGQVDPGGTDVFVYDASNGTIVMASHLPGLPATAGGGLGSSLSGDGSTVVFKCTEDLVGGSPSGYANVCVFDRATGGVTLVSHAFGSGTVGGDNGASLPTVSGDGSTVAFFSYSTNLLDHPIVVQFFGNAFAWERATGAVRLVSHRFGMEGEPAARVATDAPPGVSRDGRYVAFESTAPDLVPGDYNTFPDVFLFGPIGPAVADLAVTKTDFQDTVAAGEFLTYTISLTNNGPGGVSGAALSDALPSVIPSPFWFCSPNPGASCGAAAGTGDVQMLADLVPGATLDLYVNGYLDPAAPPGTLTNTVSVAAPAGISDPNTANNTAVDTDTLIVEADLVATQADAPDPVHVGQNVTYTVVASNHGPSLAAGGTVTDTLPAGTALVSTVPGPPTCNPAGSTVTCSFGTLPVDTAASFDVTVQTSAVGPITNEAEISGITPDPHSFNNLSLEMSLVVARPPGELVHGSVEVRDLDPATSPTTGPDLFRLWQRKESSYQVVVDAATGDISFGAGPLLDRVLEDGATVIQASVPLGAGGSRSLSWENAQTIPVEDQYIRVASASCAPCGPTDTYRVRAWETTLTGARYNNSASQVTVLVLENTTDAPVAGNVWFHSVGGPPYTFQSFSMAPHGTFTLNTSTVVPGTSGSVLVTHTAPYGALSGKLVSVEPATGFTFDTALRARPR